MARPGEVKISLFDDKAIVRLEKKLGGLPAMMKRVGMILLRDSMQAFERQAFGDIKWPERYPNQHGGKVNIAGAVSDLQHGSTIKDRRFEPRPAAMDTGKLKRSLTVLVADGLSVTVGTNLPYANIQHQGGETTQAVTPAVKANLRKWILKTEKAYTKDSFPSLMLVRKNSAAKRLYFLLEHDVNELVTQVNPRPFVGITEDARRDVAEAITGELGE